MVPKRVTFLLLLVVTIASACNFDLLLDTLYDDDVSGEDEASTPKPSNSNATPAPSSGGSSAASKPTTPLAAPTTPLSAPQPNTVAPSNSREARRHRKRKHIIGRISPGKEEVRNIDPSFVRYAPGYPENKNNDQLSKSGHISQDVFDHGKESANKDSHSSLGLESILALLRLNEDDLELADTGKNTISHQEILLKLLMAEMEENIKMRKLKHKELARQKANKSAFEVFLKLLESNLKHQHADKKEESGVSQQVIILTNGNKEKDDKFKKEIKCEADENDYVTCVKDQTIYETMKLSPKQHSGMHKVEENTHYYSIKDHHNMKDSIDKVFNSKHPHDEPHPSYHYNDRPYNSHPYDDDYRRPHHPYIDTSSRFNPEDKDKSEDKVGENLPNKEVEMNSTGAIESTTSMPVSEKP